MMHLVDNITALSLDTVEAIEKLSMHWLFQAVLDFGMEAHLIFRMSPDEVKDIAQDITREALDRLAGFNIPQRIFGTVDYKRGRYVIAPDFVVRQALFIDSKAEKENRTATIQMSQTSLKIKQQRGGTVVSESGLLPTIAFYGDEQYLTTTMLIHYFYEDIKNESDQDFHNLIETTICCIPSGLLQERYNPNEQDTFWLAGRNAPTLGEDFRVRLSFERLKQKARWRVQNIQYDASTNQPTGQWSE